VAEKLTKGSEAEPPVRNEMHLSVLKTAYNLDILGRKLPCEERRGRPSAIALVWGNTRRTKRKKRIKGQKIQSAYPLKAIRL